MGESPDSGIRVSDAERELAVRALTKHLRAGRLRPGEHEERCANARVASTRADIEALFTDLPAPYPDLSAARSRATVEARARQSERSDAIGGIGVIALLVGLPVAITLTIVSGMWWTFFPVCGVFVLCVAVAIWMDPEPRPAVDPAEDDDNDEDDYEDDYEDNDGDGDDGEDVDDDRSVVR